MRIRRKTRDLEAGEWAGMTDCPKTKVTRMGEVKQKGGFRDGGSKILEDL